MMNQRTPNSELRTINCSIYLGERGSLLVGLVIVMTLMAVMAAGVYQFTRNTSFSGLFANNTSRAYYIAESGGLFAVPLVKADPPSATTSLNGKIYTLSNGKFTLTIDNTNTSYTLIYSTGTVNEGSWSEAKRQIIYKILKTTSDSFTTQANFDSNYTVQTGGDADIRNTGPSDNQPALNFEKRENLASYNWDGYNGVTNSNAPNLVNFRTQSDNLLSYELQVKVKEEVQGSKGEHYMIGLSFRLETNDTTTATDDIYYGVSFFRSIGRSDTQRPAWINNLPTTFDLMMSSSGLRYIIFWKKVNGVYTLLDYKLLTTADNVVNTNNTLKAWSTMIVKVVEQYQSIGGNRVDDGTNLCATDNNHCLRDNLITVYVQGACATDTTDNTCSGTVLYPLNTINWTYSNFNLVTWGWKVSGQTVNSPQTVIDNNGNTLINGYQALTSAGFSTAREEIGLHSYYDSNAAEDQFLDDFAFRLTSGGGTGDIQYY